MVAAVVVLFSEVVVVFLVLKTDVVVVFLRLKTDVVLVFLVFLTSIRRMTALDPTVILVLSLEGRQLCPSVAAV